MSTRLIAVVLGLSACSSSMTPAAQQTTPVTVDKPATPETFERDTTQATAHGTASFVVPAGWSLVKERELTRARAPEGDEVFVIVDLAGSTGEAAIAAAWQAAGRTPQWRVDQTSELPARDGWLGGTEIIYEVPPNAKRSVRAFALHGTARTIVVLLDTELASFERRMSSLSLLADSLRPSGYQRESFKGRKAHVLDAVRLARLDALVDLAQKELAIPGVAIAIAQSGQTIHLRGYGEREQGKPAAVDGDTMFMVASMTKPLTTLLLAQLVDEGKLRWDTPISEALPGLRIGSEETTHAMQIKHLVCACTGVPRQDWDWLIEFDKSSPKQVMASLASLEPTTQFGASFQYSNQLAAAAGFLAASTISKGKELGSAYDDAMRDRIFLPLEMHASTFDFARAMRGNFAAAHGWDADGKLAVIDPQLNRAMIPLRPAGGLWSNARDMIRYVQLELDKGAVAGTTKRIVSEQNLMERRVKQVSMGEHAAYGMGLGVDTTYGVEIVGHDGGMFGFRTMMFWLPEHNVGAVILTSSDYGFLLLQAFQRALLEQLFDGKPEAIEDLEIAARNQRAALASERAKLTIPADSQVVSALAARYVEQSARLGAVTLQQNNGVTTLDVGEWRSPVATKRNEDGTTSLVTVGPGIVGIPFVVGQSGQAGDGKRSLTLRDAQHEYSFVEAAAATDERKSR